MMLRFLRQSRSAITVRIVARATQYAITTILRFYAHSCCLQKHHNVRGLSSVPLSRFEETTSLEETYGKLDERLNVVRSKISAPLTLAEKVVYGHLDDPSTAGEIVRGQSYLNLRPGSLYRCIVDASSFGTDRLCLILQIALLCKTPLR